MYRHRRLRCSKNPNSKKLSNSITDENKTCIQKNEEIAKLTEQVQTLAEVITQFSKTGINTTNNITNNTINVTVYYSPQLINLYDTKKLLYGNTIAFDYLHKYLKESKPSNKLNWIRDPDIIGQSDIPIIRAENGDYLVNINPTTIEKCDVQRINSIGNDIISNSVLKAINELTNTLSENFNDNNEDYFSPLYAGPFGKGIYDDLNRFRKISLTDKHLKYVSREK